MPSTELCEAVYAGQSIFRVFEDEQVGAGVLTDIRPQSPEPYSGLPGVYVKFVSPSSANSYYDHGDILSIDGEPISDPERVILDDELAKKAILEGIKQAKSHAEMQEAIYGDGEGHERDPFWPMISI